ncbi:MAG: histidine kinase, partial [Lachnospiraceae bacterium]|nr:histidine kinase [Lachnospiraceae bacterium]
AMIPLIVLSYVFVTRQIVKPLRSLTEVSKRIEAGEVGSTVEAKMPNKEFEGLTDSFNSMSSQVKRLIDTVYVEQIAAKDALIESLQAQINPHFLNNTLEMMNWQARMNGDIETSKMIESLGTVLDFSINRNHTKLVRLADELRCVDAYLYIMSMRFGQRLTVEKEIDEALMGFMVPSLILQPLLENAIKYGVEQISQGKIVLKCYKASENIYIEVMNTGKHIDEAGMQHIRDIIDGTYRLEKAEPGMHTSIGIYNVNKRIRLIYGNDYGLSVQLSADDQFISTIKLPMPQEEVR